MLSPFVDAAAFRAVTKSFGSVKVRFRVYVVKLVGGTYWLGHRRTAFRYVSLGIVVAVGSW
jgi:hypothetical protein